MDEIKSLTAKQAREKLADRQEKLGKVFEEAKAAGVDGATGYDFSKVTCLGADVKGGVAVAEKVKAMNAEADALAEHAETLEAAEYAEKGWQLREKARRNLPLPGQGDPEAKGRVKSLGERIVGEKAYQAYADRGAPGGIDFSYADMWPSELLAKGASFETLGTKTLMTRAAGYAPEVTRMGGFVEAVTRPIQVLDIFPMFPTDQSAVKYMEETTRTHAAAETAEGATFAESTFAFTEKSSPVQKVTDSVPVTDEQLEDVAMMGGYIDSRISFGLRQRIDTQSVTGNGTGSSLRGLKSLTGILTQAKGTDPVMDAFFKAMTNIRVTGRAIPTHHLIHPLDWQGIRLTRTTDGIYIFGSPTEAGPERLWGLPVVQQDADVQGRGYTGSFLPPYVSMFENKGVDIKIGYVGTQFAEGKRTVRGDTRLALVFFRPSAFSEVTGL